MEFREHAVLPGLRAAVRAIWSLRDDAPSAQQPVPPDGCVELVFNFGDPIEEIAPGRGLQPRALVASDIAQPITIRPTGRLDIIGIRLAPGRSVDWLGEVGGTLALDDAAGLGLRKALAPVFDIEPVALRVRRLQEALVLEARPARAHVGMALGILERSGGRMAIEALAAHVALSPRQLERRFRAETGGSPKAFAQVFRFQRALRSLAAGDGADLALACGYFDQAHLIREFKRFTSMSPRAYLGAGHPLADRFYEDVGFVQSAPAADRYR